MDLETKQKIEEQGAKIDAIYKSVEKTRKYFQIILWVTILLFVIPAIALIFIVPSFISTYINLLGGL